MNFGVSIPNFGYYFDVRKTAMLAREAEQSGWDGFFVWDHLLWPMHPAPVADPWVLLTAIALQTERVRLGTMVTPLSRRRPWKLARETVTLDHLSNGRLILGVGLGTSSSKSLRLSTKRSHLASAPKCWMNPWKS